MKVNTFLMLTFMLCGFGSCMLGMQKEEGSSGSDGSGNGKACKKTRLDQYQEPASFPHSVGKIPLPSPAGSDQPSLAAIVVDHMRQEVASPTTPATCRNRKKSKSGPVVLEIPASPSTDTIKLFRDMEFQFHNLYQAIMKHAEAQGSNKRVKGRHSIADQNVLSGQSREEKVQIMHDIIRLKGGSHRDGHGNTKTDKKLLLEDASSDPGRFDLELMQAIDHIYRLRVKKDFVQNVKGALITALGPLRESPSDSQSDEDHDHSDCSQHSSTLSEVLDEDDDNNAIVSVLNRIHLQKDAHVEKHKNRSFWRGIKMWVSSIVGSAMTIAAGTLYVLKQIEACCPCPEASPLNSTRTFF